MATQDSDVSMGEGYTESQLQRAVDDLMAADPTNDRLPDALAKDAVKTGTAAVEQTGSKDPPASKKKDGEADATGKCESSNGASSDDEADGDFERDGAADLASLMEAGGELMSRFGSQSQSLSQMTNDRDFKEEEIREEFAKIKTSTWMQKKLDKTTTELEKQVKQHENSKKELVAPVKELIVLYPEKKTALTLMSGLLSDACTDGDLRDAIITAANVLKSQTKIVENIQENMKVIEVGRVCFEEKKEEEEKKRGHSSSTMSAAAALLAGAEDSRKEKKQRKM
jgi:hypothetical protein